MAKKKAKNPSHSSSKGKQPSGGGLTPLAKAGIVAVILPVALGLFFVKNRGSSPASPVVASSSSDVWKPNAPASTGTDTVPLTITSMDMGSV